jgi:hypothetical protein
LWWIKLRGRENSSALCRRRRPRRRQGDCERCNVRRNRRGNIVEKPCRLSLRLSFDVLCSPPLSRHFASPFSTTRAQRNTYEPKKARRNRTRTTFSLKKKPSSLLRRPIYLRLRNNMRLSRRLQILLGNTGGSGSGSGGVLIGLFLDGSVAVEERDVVAVFVKACPWRIGRSV